MVHCADCGGETEISAGYRLCLGCGCKTRMRTISGRTARKPRYQNIPIRTPEVKKTRRMTPKKEPMDIDPDGTLEERLMIGMDHGTKPPFVSAFKFTGGGVEGACHECGNAFGECECPS
jgi:hypothetical protein